MAHIARKSDGRRLFTAEFKREQLARVARGELTMAELSRKLGIAGSLLYRWRRLMPQSAGLARVALPLAAPVLRLEGAEYIRQLQLLVGKQAVELEWLRGELDALKRGPRSRRAFSGGSET